MLFVAEDAQSLISLSVKNPLNGNILEFTNKMVADASYYTGMIFILRAAIFMMRTGSLRTMSETRFLHI